MVTIEPQRLCLLAHCKPAGLFLMLHFRRSEGKVGPGNPQPEEHFEIHLELRIGSGAKTEQH